MLRYLGYIGGGYPEQQRLIDELFNLKFDLKFDYEIRVKQKFSVAMNWGLLETRIYVDMENPFPMVEFLESNHFDLYNDDGHWWEDVKPTEKAVDAEIMARHEQERRREGGYL